MGTSTEGRLALRSTRVLDRTGARAASDSSHGAIAATIAAILASALAAGSVVVAEPRVAHADEPQILLQEITPASFPMWIWHAGDDRLFIIERRGAIRIWTKEDGLLETPFLDLDPLVGEGGERGMYSIAFHPDYASNGYFFVSYHPPGADSHVVVERFRVSATDPNVADPSSALRVLEVHKPEDIHNGSELMFGPDGYLWIAFGDGNAGDGGCRVQSGDFLLGKMIRIDVDQIQDGVPFSYGIPPDNPFTAASDPLDLVRDEVYARGFRHPWRFAIDFPTGDIFIGDVGGNRWEEINRIPAGSGGGQNFGWKIMEGPDCHSDPVPAECPPDTPACFSPEFTPPIFVYSHSTVPNPTEMNGCAIIGGFVYRGSEIPELYGRYVFTDYCAGKIRSIEETSPGVWGNAKDLADSIDIPNTMGLDSHGELYVGGLSKVFKLVNGRNRHEQTPFQRACIQSMNTGTAEVAKKRLKANVECVKWASLGRLDEVDGVPPSDVSIRACFDVGLPARIQGAITSLDSREVKRCRAPGHPEQLPDFGYTSAGTAKTAGLSAAANLTASLLGPDPDAAIASTSSNPVGATCQQRVAGGVQLLYDRIWRRASEGKTRSLRGRLGSPARSPADLGEQVLRYVNDDDRKIPLAVTLLGATADDACPGQSLATLFPGDCPSTDGAALAACMHERARCHFCRQFESTDGLSLDCDEFDNQVIDGSCPSAAEMLCQTGGSGVNWAAYAATCPRLSDYRLFGDPGDPTQAPSPGGVPFHLTTPLFSDYAQKHRFVFLPPGTQATYEPTKPFSFPVGTIIAKTFSFAHDLRDLGLGADLVETRLLIRRDLGWVGLPYIWNTSTGEAELALQGGSYDASWIHFDGTTHATTYRIPSSVQCGSCHVGDDGAGDVPIGPKARLLNTTFAYPGGTENQLDHWTSLGILAGAPPSAGAPRLPVWDDPGDGTLEQRARAYLETNCAHCHNPAGIASFTGLELTHDHPLDEGYGICRVSGFDQAPGLIYDIVPGDPDHSVLTWRLGAVADGVKMPPLLRSVVHDEGLALVDSWIASLPGGCP